MPAAEAEDIGIDDLGIDPGFVHDRQTLLDVRGAGVDVLELEFEELVEVADLAALLEHR